MWCKMMGLLFQVGMATAIGEQPVKGLVSCEAGARMAVAESLSNLVFARISDLKVLDLNVSNNNHSSNNFSIQESHYNS